MTDPALVPVRRALLSVSDKSGLIPLAKALHEGGTELVSTGGTARAIADAGLPVTPIDEVTGFPEMMDGRVKTLHPNVHGGLLALRDNQAHVDAMHSHGIAPIDLVCINLYPFERTIESEGVTDAEAIEQIDIGGPSMVRSAAKNHRSVAILTDPAQYEAVIAELHTNQHSTSYPLRRAMARAAFQRTAAYDAAIANYFAKADQIETPEALFIVGERPTTLRYGENPHQAAAVYRTQSDQSASVISATQLAGKPLSFNNINDATAALALAYSIARIAPARIGAAVVKHTNPCGASSADSTDAAVQAALAGDPLAAFGGILATSGSIDRTVAERIATEGSFFEVVVAPEISDEAVQILEARWKNCRLLAAGAPDTTLPDTPDIRVLPGGLLVQERDVVVPDPASWKLEAGPEVDARTRAAAAVLAAIGRSLSSNAVCLGGVADDGSVRLYGAGAGQMDRVASCRLAIEKADDLAPGSIAYSDAFFPFPDGPELLLNAGVKVIVHPGGSKRDQETFDLCTARGASCLTTGLRHFRH